MMEKTAQMIAQIPQSVESGCAASPAPLVVEKLLLSLDEAACLLGIPRGTLRTWSWACRVPCVRLGRRRFFRRDDLVRWIDLNTCPATGRLPSRLTKTKERGYRPVQDAQPVKGG